MASMAQRLWKAGNAASAWMYRGKVGGRARGGSPVLLLTVAGRRFGMPHTVPVAYVERDGAYPPTPLRGEVGSPDRGRAPHPHGVSNNHIDSSDWREPRASGYRGSGVIPPGV